MQHLMVPIVYGGANYSQYFPSHSYIDIRDYASPKHLAIYLTFLLENPEKYNEYFHWKTKLYMHPDREFSRKEAFCKLCEMLHNDKLPEKSYSDLRSWWSKDKCEDQHKVMNKLMSKPSHGPSKESVMTP